MRHRARLVRLSRPVGGGPVGGRLRRLPAAGEGHRRGQPHRPVRRARRRVRARSTPAWRWSPRATAASRCCATSRSSASRFDLAGDRRRAAHRAAAVRPRRPRDGRAVRELVLLVRHQPDRARRVAEEPAGRAAHGRRLVRAHHRGRTCASGSPTRASTPPATAPSWCCSWPSAPTTTPILFEDMIMGRVHVAGHRRAARSDRGHRGPRDRSRPAPDAHVVLRGSSVQLVALLESGRPRLRLRIRERRPAARARVRASCPAPCDLGDPTWRRPVRRRWRSSSTSGASPACGPVFRGDVDPLRVHHPRERAGPRAGCGVRRLPGRRRGPQDPARRPPAPAHAARARRRGRRPGGGETGVRGITVSVLRISRRPSAPGPRARPCRRGAAVDGRRRRRRAPRCQ